MSAAAVDHTYPQEGRCAICGCPGWFVERYAWISRGRSSSYELQSSAWEHSVHPADAHEFLPVRDDVCPWHPQSPESADRAARSYR